LRESKTSGDHAGLKSSDHRQGNRRIVTVHCGRRHRPRRKVAVICPACDSRPACRGVRGRHGCPGRRFRRPEHSMPWTTSRDQVKQPVEHPESESGLPVNLRIRRTADGSLAKTARGTTSVRRGNPGRDGARRESDCPAAILRLLEGNGMCKPAEHSSRGNAAGTWPFDGHRHARVHRVRWGRPPRSPRVPAIVETLKGDE